MTVEAGCDDQEATGMTVGRHGRTGRASDKEADNRMDVREVTTPALLKAFIHLPWRIYRGDPNWVPPLLSDQWQTLQGQNNPLFQAGPHAAFVAYKNGLPAGRILCGVNAATNQVKDRNVGYLSLFESVDDLEVARALFAAAEDWLRRQGVSGVQGPASPTGGDDYRGLLVEGFDGPPVLWDSYNPAYYAGLFTACGYSKKLDLWAFRYDRERVPERLGRVSAYAMERYGFGVSGVRLRDLSRDLRDIKAVLDRAMPAEWEDLAPPSLDDVEAVARRLRPLVEPDLCVIARTAAGEPIGFAIGLPNYNEVLRHMNGRLFPLGWLQYLLRRRRIRGVRIFILFVVPEWRKKAVTGAMFNHMMAAAVRLGYTWGEGSTIGETNTAMIREAEGAGGVHYRTYRIYEKAL